MCIRDRLFGIASTVEAIPKSTSNLIHPDAFRFDLSATTPSDISGDYRGLHFCLGDWAGRTRPRELWLRARRRGGFDPDRTSGRHDESRIHDSFVRGALIADHEGLSPTLDERLVRAIRCGLAARVVCGAVSYTHLTLPTIYSV